MDKRPATSEAPGALALFGGSFDPPHVGHVLAVHYVLLTTPAERVLVVPCAEHPFGKDHLPFEHRFKMCRIAFESLGAGAKVLDIEGRREGVSYTIDTVREIAATHPGAPLEMIVGSDIMAEIAEWKDSEALQRLAPLRVLPRLGASPSDAATPFYLPQVSSSDVRQLLREGRDATPHLPRRVLDYIRRNDLYGTL
jgi:nicotinate-nucleotide adenylyltransferase